ncbi:substrate-binding domain-containing protein [Paenibacillus sp. CC-CFT747]|nr:substrate-binding domain-containing protein [Paenibacillus sp. CC-CFT747]
MEEASRHHGYQMLFNYLSDEDLEQGRVPETITALKPEGVVLAGITRKEFARALSRLEIPFVLIDGYYEERTNDLLCDSVLMESEQSTFELTSCLIEQNHREIGFIGDVSNCKSFMERWIGFKRAVTDAGFSVRRDYCLVEPSPDNYFKLPEIASRLDSMPELPSAFVCANDLIAYHLIAYLEGKGLRVPQDISVTGFDYMQQQPDMAPIPLQLATAEVSGMEIGSRAFEQLLWRFQHLDRPFETVRVASRIIPGDSTGPCAGE